MVASLREIDRSCCVGAAQAAGRIMGDDGPSSDDIIKILITSDNHVGYDEKDEIRGNDSFRTFEEVLKIAADEKVRARSAGAPCPCTPSVRPSVRPSVLPWSSACPAAWLSVQSPRRASEAGATSAPVFEFSDPCSLTRAVCLPPSPPLLPAQVDMILNGGDLFHDNKPSRRTLVRSAPLSVSLSLARSLAALRAAASSQD